MFLKNLSILNFKNCEEASFEFTSGVNFFTGYNGMGKTNILDAIHYLSLCKSYFNSMDSQNIQREKDFMMIQGVFSKNDKQDVIHCAVKKGQKKTFKKNKKEYARLAEHIGIYPLVMISPSDINLILSGSEVRRKFIDSVISQYSKSYLEDLINYKKILNQRNALLKYFGKERTFDQHSLAVWTEQLVEYGNRIHHTRKEFLDSFVTIFQEYYAFISGEKESVSLTYNSQLNEMSFAELLDKNLEKDRIMQYSTCGIHKDDLVLEINGFPIKKFSSQGQQKSYLIAMKLAQFQFIKNVKKIMPLLLLDDVFDKLDSKRVHSMMELISESKFGQIFITDTNKDRLLTIFENIEIGQNYFEIDNGEKVNEEEK